MASSAITADQPFLFSKSTSAPVGMGGSVMDTLRDNSPRIVGGLKLVGDVIFGFSGNPLLIGYAIFSVIGRLELIVFGTKDNQKTQLEKEKKENAGEQEANYLTKLLQPHKYPIEASTGLSIVGEALYVAWGITEILAGGAGITPVLVGGASLLLYANMFLTKEKSISERKKEESMPFASSKSEPVGFFDKVKETMKGNPVLTSSLVGLAIASTNMIGSFLEGKPLIAMGAVLFVTSYIFQAIFVRKNEFNIEGAREEAKLKEEKLQGNHAGKVLQGRQDSDRSQIIVPQ